MWKLSPFLRDSAFQIKPVKSSGNKNTQSAAAADLATLTCLDFFLSHRDGEPGAGDFRTGVSLVSALWFPGRGGVTALTGQGLRK